MQPTHVLILGGFSIAVGLVCFLFYSKNKKLLEEMWAVDTYSALDLKRMVKGGFDATVEVEGTVSCDNPIVSLAANIPCCYCCTTVSRQVRRTKTITSGSGSSRRTRIETDYVWTEEMNEINSAVFKVRDRTGETLVNPVGASIDTKTVVDQIVRFKEPWFASHVGISDTGQYRIRESVFKPEGFVYVLGQATATEDGEALIQYPSKGYMDPKNKFFIISRKSEKELNRKKQRLGRVLLVLSAVSFLAVLYSVLAYFGIAPGLRK